MFLDPQVVENICINHSAICMMLRHLYGERNYVSVCFFSLVFRASCFDRGSVNGMNEPALIVFSRSV